MQDWEVPDYLSEILLSYRLLFGQSRASRQRFSNIQPLSQVSKDELDQLLIRLCSDEHSPVPERLLDQKDYPLMSSFPILRNRILRLQQYLDDQKPENWKELWHDRRNIADYWTFWSVLVLGTIGLILSSLSLAVGALQLWRQW